MVERTPISLGDMFQMRTYPIPNFGHLKEGGLIGQIDWLNQGGIPLWLYLNIGRMQCGRRQSAGDPWWMRTCASHPYQVRECGRE